jgi:hypothetical protein
VEHASVFSGLPEIFFNDSDSTRRGDFDLMHHADEGLPKREERRARNVLGGIPVHKVNERPKRPEE